MGRAASTNRRDVGPLRPAFGRLGGLCAIGVGRLIRDDHATFGGVPACAAGGEVPVTATAELTGSGASSVEALRADRCSRIGDQLARVTGEVAALPEGCRIKFTSRNGPDNRHTQTGQAQLESLCFRRTCPTGVSGLSSCWGTFAVLRRRYGCRGRPSPTARCSMHPATQLVSAGHRGGDAARLASRLPASRDRLAEVAGKAGRARGVAGNLECRRSTASAGHRYTRVIRPFACFDTEPDRR